MAEKVLRIIFDGPPGHEAGRFIEVESESGKSVSGGEWREINDGLWELRIDLLPALARARAEGRVEGVQKATDEIVLRMPCPGLDPERDETKRVVMGVLNRHIAAAERELAGGKEEEES